MKLRALGTIVEWPDDEMTPSDFYCGMLDYYDHWKSVDPRLAQHHRVLSQSADAFGQDIINLATYCNEILGWLAPSRIRCPPSVVIVGGMTEAFMYSVRSACDAVAAALAQYACEKPGQVPRNSLSDLIQWAQKNPSRADPDIAALLSSDFGWFWKLRKMRDALGHRGAHANIHCNGRQFNLWLYGPDGWMTREPLLPLLAGQLQALISFGDEAAQVINMIIGMPADRLRSRVVNGVLISALHHLLQIANEYSDPSP
jgi:hypothetical protein